MGKISEIFNFENIGKKIKNLTKWSCWITIVLIWIAAPIVAIALMADGWEIEWLIPLAAAIVAPFFIWIGSWTVYAFGEIVDKATAVELNTCGREIKSEAQTRIDEKRISKIEKLRSQGLITEEEYQQAISKVK